MTSSDSESPRLTLQTLPPDILYLFLTTTASSTHPETAIHLSQTCRVLYSTFAANKTNILRTALQTLTGDRYQDALALARKELMGTLYKRNPTEVGRARKNGEGGRPLSAEAGYNSNDDSGSDSDSGSEMDSDSYFSSDSDYDSSSSSGPSRRNSKSQGPTQMDLFNKALSTHPLLRRLARLALLRHHLTYHANRHSTSHNSVSTSRTPPVPSLHTRAGSYFLSAAYSFALHGAPNYDQWKAAEALRLPVSSPGLHNRHYDAAEDARLVLLHMLNASVVTVLAREKALWSDGGFILAGRESGFGARCLEMARVVVGWRGVCGAAGVKRREWEEWESGDLEAEERERIGRAWAERVCEKGEAGLGGFLGWWRGEEVVG